MNNSLLKRYCKIHFCMVLHTTHAWVKGEPLRFNRILPLNEHALLYIKLKYMYRYYFLISRHFLSVQHELFTSSSFLSRWDMTRSLRCGISQAKVIWVVQNFLEGSPRLGQAKTKAWSELKWLSIVAESKSMTCPTPKPHLQRWQQQHLQSHLNVHHMWSPGLQYIQKKQKFINVRPYHRLLWVSHQFAFESQNMTQ